MSVDDGTVVRRRHEPSDVEKIILTDPQDTAADTTELATSETEETE